MKWPPFVRLVVACAAAALAGCGDREPPRPLFPTTDAPGDIPSPIASADPVGAGAGESTLATAEDPEGKGVVIDSVVSMLEKAPLNPGGDFFTMATQQLNHYFVRTPDKDFALSSEVKQFLDRRLVEDVVKSLGRELQAREFTIKDARHIEDCMLYRAVAARVAGDGDDLTRARRVFDWVVRQVELVPVNSLGVPPSPGAPQGLPQVPARPYDVLLRGMACETGTYWAERAWLFAALCRQIGIDVGLLAFLPPDQAAKKPVGRDIETDPTYVACIVLADGKPYLFDARIGLAIPGPGGQGVATVEDAIADPTILGRLILSAGDPYPARAEDLAAGHLLVMLDSAPGYLSPRMRLLEKELSGKNRLALYRDPVEAEAAFRAALGERFGSAELWRLPLEVAIRLFTDPNFVLATQYPMQFFDSQLPLLQARMRQLRGELDEAIQNYVTIRYPESPTMADKKTPIPEPVQHAIDMYATYFLAMCHVEAGHGEQAEFMLKETLRLMPAVGQGLPLYNMYRWGATTNLGLMSDARHDRLAAIRYLGEDVRTPQNVSNRLRARALLWPDPFTSPDDGPADGPRAE